MPAFFRRPQQPEDSLRADPPRGTSPSPSRISSRWSVNPPTPGAVSDGGDDYFESLSAFPSFHSQTPSQRFDAPPTPPVQRPASQQARLRLPSIRLRRTSTASQNSQRDSFPSFDGYFDGHDWAEDNRPRSISQPERARVYDNPLLARHSRRQPQIALPRLTEEGGRPSLAELGVDQTSPLSPSLPLPEQTTARSDELDNPTRMQRARALSRRLWPGHRRNPHEGPVDPDGKAEYAQELVDWLDTIDPEVQTLSTLTNVQNSLFIPDLGKWVNRRPTYTLSQHEERWARGAMAAEDERQQEAAREAARESTLQPETPGEAPSRVQRSMTITSRLTDSHYAALPHGTTLEGWTAEEKMELDDHVRHMLHSRRSRFKRRLKGFGQYVRRPLGFFVTLYATLITLFGLAWVLFLIGWIYVGEKQVYAIHVIDSVLVALFAIMGDGLAPFRAVDTYHMYYIARYSRMIENAKKGKPPRARLQKKNIPLEIKESIEREAQEQQQRAFWRSASLQDETNTNPINSSQDQFVDVENGKTEFDHSWLTPKQQRSLEHHQAKLAKSHSFYKPQETFTHYAFPLGYLIAIVILLDCHSCLQISLGACTWGIDYHVRPFALTTVILCVSITCNVTAGLVITIGDRKTRKKDVLKLMDRQELTSDAIKIVEEKRKKEQESGESSPREGVLSKESSMDGSGSTSASASGSGTGEGSSSERRTKLSKEQEQTWI